MAVTFDNILNFRDVGQTVNEYLGRKILQEGVLYRSARPDDATLSDRRRLTDEFGIKTVIDLRTKTEHLKQAQKRDADVRTPALLASNAALAEPVQLPGVQYREIRVTGRRFERYLLGQLGWLSFFKLIFLFVLGYRMQAISILGREVMQPRGLVGLGTITLDESGEEIAEALQTLLVPSGTPVLVHCTQGKDRTGLLVALVLLALRVPADAAAHDYLLSRAGLAAEKEARLAEIREIGLTPEWGDCPPDFVARVVEHLEAKYGGVDAYLDGIGFGVEERRRLGEALGA
ncbi:tyrosine/serine protein phosphatase [Xylariomycetidae sp. FL0641]|nr:tyrosine/serine protein phosphatase [Xylariomycetidae sp. FL0641]